MSRVVLVTGCSTGGIGFALSSEFARHGCKVYATSRNIDTIGDIPFDSVEKIALDVNDDEIVNRVIKQIAEKEGRIDIVVNNAGFICAGPLLDQNLDDVKANFETNTFAVIRVAKAVVPLMAQRRSGLIINIGSIVGEIATPWNGVYSASKAALQSISDVLSMECRPFNVKVFHVAPGGIKSNIATNGMTRYKLPEGSLYAKYLPNIIQRIHASQVPGSMATDTFAKIVVGKALRKKPPVYMSMGAKSFILSAVKRLPKAWALWIMWWVHTRRVTP